MSGYSEWSPRQTSLLWPKPLVNYRENHKPRSVLRHLGDNGHQYFLPSPIFHRGSHVLTSTLLRQATTELRVSAGHQRKRYLLYLLYVCAMTGALVAAAVTTDDSGAEDDPYRPAFGERVCWFSRRKSLMVFFAAPLIVIMAANVVFFLGSTRIIRKTTQSTASMSCGPTKVRE